MERPSGQSVAKGDLREYGHRNRKGNDHNARGRILLAGHSSTGQAFMFRLLVVDDHEAIRSGLSSCLDGLDVEMCATAGGTEEVVRTVTENEIDVVLLDIQLKEEDGLSLLIRLRSEFPELRIVLFSAFDYHVYVARAAANGADDFVLKSDPITRFHQVLKYVHQNGSPIPGGRLDRVIRLLRQTSSNDKLPTDVSLTQRETQVLRHVAFGLSNREIATSLGISVETVKEHVQNVLRKSGSKDRTDAAVKAVRFGLTD
ncbi:MAG: response regulator transcription factor [Planctomycetota bacterium]